MFSLPWVTRHRALVTRISRFSSKLKSVNLTAPHLWFDDARKLSRKIICHIGPTNSGKTYTALQRLKECNRGIYCGPLRLLAWEVCETLRSENIKCNLITGNERELFESGGTHTSSTVEMVDLFKEYDVAVIDEAQLIGDTERGWAWTQAFLGVKATEIHVCGSPTLVPIIKALAKLTGDSLEICTYKRLSPLSVQRTALHDFSHLRPGDCVVGFSRKQLFAFKTMIEKGNPSLRCCVIYGSLPPDARKQQARLFDDPNSGYNILLATDAIGMGLNLAIRRIVFSDVEKFDGRGRRQLSTAEFKQIAGRAGRFGSRYGEGLVACLHDEDIEEMQLSLQEDDIDIRRAGLFPTFEQLELLSLLLQYNVNEALLESFWNIRFAELWDESAAVRSDSSSATDGGAGLSAFTMQSIKSYGLNHGAIVRHFGSVAKFNESFAAFLVTEGNSTVTDDYSNREPSRVNRKEEKRSGKWDKPSKGQNEERMALPDRSNRFRESRSRHSSMQYLLALFQRRAELDPSGLFFLCHMDSVFALARVLDKYPKISLRDKYVWVIAPVSESDPLSMLYYETYVSQFEEKGIVNLGITIEDAQVPRDPKRLLEYESMHKVFELYLWLSLRFPTHFTDGDMARRERDICTNLIDQGLQSLSPVIKRAHKWMKKEKKKGKKVFVAKASHDSDY